MSTPRYIESERLLKNALKTIPLGSQTFSKSTTQYPFGVSPYFASKAEGSYLWDVDGNKYIDFINSLAAINLGYGDPDVNAAVHRQVDEGTIFSLSHTLEIEVAEKMVEMIPCAEMVRFGKNGSDATAGAIRIARAYTGRDYVAVCGYHGWQDWYIGSTARNLGVPEVTKELTKPFKYNDLSSLETLFKEYPGKIAGVILEPMNIFYPEDGFLEGVKELAHKNGALLVFDETVTGFRFANGGAQELFNVTPDLATFGKGLANGYPLSAVVGKREYMKLMEEVFFSFTFGGETLSLAAALASMNKLQTHDVIKKVYSLGEELVKGVRALISKHKVEHIFNIHGNPTWTFLMVKDVDSYTQWELKTLFLQEIFSRGILSLGTHNLSYAHSSEDIKQLVGVYNEVFPLIRDAIKERSVKDVLRCNPLEPLFKVRQ